MSLVRNPALANAAPARMPNTAARTAKEATGAPTKRPAKQPAGPAPQKPTVEPFNLANFGDEGAEKRQLEQHLGWRGAVEVGKFYDHRGSDEWYYYVYGDARAFNTNSGLPANEAAGSVCHKRVVYGDVGIVRSGPVGSEYAEEFSKTESVKAVEFYRKNDKDKVFTQREMSRSMRAFGAPGGGF
ncbi:MAG: hypothetical protein ALECFALPRED_010273 [Alectoria fallacina]|uniref:Uncharacterized protein n=1 Tax=Alectoria fallacina TaxID=1903189 RepID=A0A8H3J992_9LECA|nr:MAG: hypothetical protein ALECFALPRED_010273 [Alectoria fallacina]